MPTEVYQSMSLDDRQKALIAAAMISHNHEAVDAILDTMTLRELEDLVDAMNVIHRRAWLMADRKEERGDDR
jgi:hypothetical protein